MSLYDTALFPTRLRELRKKFNMTQRELAEHFGVATNTISSWETGKQEPDRCTYAKIAEFFGVTVDSLFGRTENQHGWEFTNLSPEELIIIKLFRTKK